MKGVGNETFDGNGRRTILRPKKGFQSSHTSATTSRNEGLDLKYVSQKRLGACYRDYISCGGFPKVDASGLLSKPGLLPSPLRRVGRPCIRGNIFTYLVQPQGSVLLCAAPQS